MMRKGVSPLISYALYVGIGLSAVVLALQTAIPFVENARDTSSIQNMQSELSQLEQEISSIARQGRGAQTVHDLNINRGELAIENQSIVYSIQSNSDIISAGSKRRIGRLILSANAEASLTETTYNGNECYRMQNEYIDACIHKFGDEDSFESASLDDAIEYITNTQQDITIEPTIRSMIDSDPAYNSGQIKTVAINEGQDLGEAQISLLVKAPDRPKYTVTITLRSSADFLIVEME